MDQLGIFAKYWQPGAVKTRLAESIGATRASQIYRHLLTMSLGRVGGLAHRRVLAFWPPEREADFQRISGGRWHVVPQCEGDLGQRLRHYFDEAFAYGADRVVLLGSDSPTLPSQYVSEAFDALDQNPVVLGPTADGGYYLVGAREKVPAIFDDIPWSTSSVWSTTVARLRRSGCPYHQLPAWYDVDDLADLERLRDELRQKEEEFDEWRELLRLTLESLRIGEASK